MATISGTCALHKDSYELSPISIDRLVAALGDGDYKVEGDVTGDSKEVPNNGTCSFYRTTEPSVRRLALSIGEKGDEFGPYAKARKTMRNDPDAVKIPDADGYVISDIVVDDDGTRLDAAQAVVFDGDRIVIAHILVPGAGTKGSAEASELALEAVQSFREPMQHRG